MVNWSIKLPKELELRYKAKIHQLEEEKKVSYITSIERLSKEEGLQQGLHQGREEGRQLNAIAIAKKRIAKGRSIQYIQDLTNLSESEVINLVELEKA